MSLERVGLFVFSIFQKIELIFPLPKYLDRTFPGGRWVVGGIGTKASPSAWLWLRAWQ
jgi:hypothetical protein